MDRGITRKPSGGTTEFAADVTASKIGAPEKSTAEKSLVTRTNAVRRHLDTPPLTLNDFRIDLAGEARFGRPTFAIWCPPHFTREMIDAFSGLMTRVINKGQIKPQVPGEKLKDGGCRIRWRIADKDQMEKLVVFFFKLQDAVSKLPLMDDERGRDKLVKYLTDEAPRTLGI